MVFCLKIINVQFGLTLQEKKRFIDEVLNVKVRSRPVCCLAVGETDEAPNDDVGCCRLQNPAPTLAAAANVIFVAV